MNDLKKEVTPPELDCGFMFIVGVISLLLALLPSFGIRTVFLIALGVLNVGNGWRLYRKIKKSRTTEQSA